LQTPLYNRENISKRLIRTAVHVWELRRGRSAARHQVSHSVKRARRKDRAWRGGRGGQSSAAFDNGSVAVEGNHGAAHRARHRYIIRGDRRRSSVEASTLTLMPPADDFGASRPVRARSSSRIDGDSSYFTTLGRLSDAC